uniref:Ig-like domain-containing protein n=1 Tax=Wuchereria bancrofti TaxID=6293 RepID=A0A1I8EKY8_WUCBA
MNGCLLLVVFIRKLCGANKQVAAVQTFVRTTSKLLGRLDLLECAVLEPIEYDKHVAKGLCPPPPTKILKTFGNKLEKLYHRKSSWLMKKEKKERKDWLMKKKLIMKAVFLGKQSFYQLRLQNVDFDFELIEGLFLILECPTRKKVKKPNIEWYLDGSPITTDSRLSWRVKLTPLKYLQIWPLMVTQDDGRYECFIDGKLYGSVTLHVITVAVSGKHALLEKEGLSRGTTNYFITMMLSIPFVAFAIFYRLLHPQREAIMLDNPVTDFYEKILHLTTKEMKSHITKTIHKDKTEREIESSHSYRRTSNGTIIVSFRQFYHRCIYLLLFYH